MTRCSWPTFGVTQNIPSCLFPFAIQRCRGAPMLSGARRQQREGLPQLAVANARLNAGIAAFLLVLLLCPRRPRDLHTLRLQQLSKHARALAPEPASFFPQAHSSHARLVTTSSPPARRLA
ncbi:hypothetical protein BD309DRAFT_625760 [Dichomitus squalens]|nr:hypothetical protein BD309DRAFT_625760 [Dichomitus squalens]